MDIIKSIQYGIGATKGLGKQTFKDGLNRIMVMGSPVEFILQGNKIIVKLRSEFSITNCGCGNPQCNKNHAYRLTGMGIATLNPDENGRLSIKFGVTLAVAKAMRSLIAQKKAIFEAEMFKDIGLYNNAANNVEVKLPGYKMPRVRGLKLNTYEYVTPAPKVKTAAAEEVAPATEVESLGEEPKD